MNDNLSFPEGSFIRPSTDSWRGKFMCCNPNCHSRKLMLDYNPRTMELTLSCTACGNAAKTKLVLELEVPDGG